MCRSNLFFILCDDGFCEGVLFNIRLCDGVLCGGFLFDGVWYVGGLFDFFLWGNDFCDRLDVENVV